jgi:hypothetical protein
MMQESPIPAAIKKGVTSRVLGDLERLLAGAGTHHHRMLSGKMRSSTAF